MWLGALEFDKLRIEPHVHRRIDELRDCAALELVGAARAGLRLERAHYGPVRGRNYGCADRNFVGIHAFWKEQKLIPPHNVHLPPPSRPARPPPPFCPPPPP